MQSYKNIVATSACFLYAGGFIKLQKLLVGTSCQIWCTLFQLLTEARDLNFPDARPVYISEVGLLCPQS